MSDMKIKEVKPTDRIQVLDMPQALPGKCAVCGNGADKDRKWIDFQADVQDYGALYICSLCIVEVANALNFASDEQTSDMLMQIKTLTTELEAAHRERDNLRSAVQHLTNAGYTSDDASSDKVAEPIPGQQTLDLDFSTDGNSETELSFN